MQKRRRLYTDLFCCRFCSFNSVAAFVWSLDWISLRHTVNCMRVKTECYIHPSLIPSSTLRSNYHPTYTALTATSSSRWTWVNQLPWWFSPFTPRFVAEWLGWRTCDQQVAGSNPGRRAAECNPGQVVYTHVSLSPKSKIWYRPMGGDAWQPGR